MSKGFGWLWEILLTLILLGLTVQILLQDSPKSNITELKVFYLQTDLLNIWLKKENLNLEEMLEDFEWVFPNANGCVRINLEKKCIETRIPRKTNVQSLSVWKYQNQSFKKIQIDLFIPVN
ncbi:MAG: hypothetical protein Q7S92_00755 [Candidatus Diapherotrites archaeon]|nr:hypothetical protein [Candidatus Diapherotrites archaeon]